MLFHSKPSTTPDGIYEATFVGINIYQLDAKKKVHCKPRWFWQFRITNGPHAGEIVGRASVPKPTENNQCGRMIAMLTTSVDGKASPFNEFAAVLYENEKVRVFVRDGAVVEVLAPRGARVRVWG